MAKGWLGMEMTVEELRNAVSTALASVERGEAVTITCRGKPAARLVAADEGTAAQGAATMPAFGMWRDRQDLADVDAHLHELRGGRAIAG